MEAEPKYYYLGSDCEPTTCNICCHRHEPGGGHVLDGLCIRESGVLAAHENLARWVLREGVIPPTHTPLKGRRPARQAGPGHEQGTGLPAGVGSHTCL